MIKEVNQVFVLQNRIKEKELEIKGLKSKVSDLNRINGSLVISNRELVGKVRILKGKKKNSTSNRVSSDEVVKKNRVKKIFGILKNSKKYKLNPVETSFLTDVQYLDRLSTKQFNWYKKICERGFNKNKPNYNKQLKRVGS